MSHGFKLEKNDTFNLTKESDQLKVIRAELGWETPENVFPSYDLDVSLFGLRESPTGPRLVKEDYFVYYNHHSKDKGPNIQTNDGAITKSPDELSGGVEWIKVELAKVDKAADELSFVVTIHDARKRKQSFAQVRNPYIQIFNDETNEPICVYNLEDFGNATAIQVGSLLRSGDEWIFQAVGASHQAELGDIIHQFYP